MTYKVSTHEGILVPSQSLDGALFLRFVTKYLHNSKATISEFSLKFLVTDNVTPHQRHRDML